jgi:DNA-binding NarL/FixJ family response regulator
MTIRILLADDHKNLRQFIRALIEMHTGMEVVGEAGVGRKAISMARDLSPGTVIMDVGMPQINGIDTTKEIIATVPKVKVIGLCMHTESTFVSAILGAGASGCLLKERVLEDLIEAVKAVAKTVGT